MQVSEGDRAGTATQLAPEGWQTDFACEIGDRLGWGYAGSSRHHGLTCPSSTSWITLR